MKKTIVISTIMILTLAAVSIAVNLPKTQISSILEYKTPLALTESQIKKLQIIEITTQQKLQDSKSQADIRMGEIEKFTSNWKDMNSLAVQGLVKEYYDYMTNYKLIELEAIVKARALLSKNQIGKLQELGATESMTNQSETGIKCTTVSATDCCAKPQSNCCPSPGPNCCPKSAEISNPKTMATPITAGFVSSAASRVDCSPKLDANCCPPPGPNCCPNSAEISSPKTIATPITAGFVSNAASRVDCGPKPDANCCPPSGTNCCPKAAATSCQIP